MIALCTLIAAPAAAQDTPFDAHALVDGSQWRLFAVEYAHSTGVREARLVRDADPQSRIDMSWYFFVVLGHGRVVLVDCGTDAFSRTDSEGLRESWSVERAVRVTEALARLGLSADDVTDVVLTHHHWDHVGGMTSFRRARVHAHRRGWARVASWLREPIEGARRTELIAGRSHEIWPGFVARMTGSHTRHHMMVELRCEDRPIVIAGDAAYLYRNIEESTPIAVTGAPARNVREVASAVETFGPGNVIPGHDPAIFERYESSSEGVAAICP